MLKSTMADNRILQPSAITIVPSVADIFLTLPEASTIAPPDLCSSGTKYFYDGSAIAASQRFIEKQINTKTELKFIGQAKCVRYKPDEFHKKIFTDMSRFIYYRSSTDRQTYLQQQECVSGYLKRKIGRAHV